MGVPLKILVYKGASEIKILKANKVKNLFVLVYMSESHLPLVYVRFYTLITKINICKVRSPDIAGRWN